MMHQEPQEDPVIQMIRCCLFFRHEGVPFLPDSQSVINEMVRAGSMRAVGQDIHIRFKDILLNVEVNATEAMTYARSIKHSKKYLDDNEITTSLEYANFMRFDRIQEHNDATVYGWAKFYVKDVVVKIQRIGEAHALFFYKVVNDELYPLIHPHVNSSAGGCLGSTGENFDIACKNGEIYAAMAILDNFLCGYNQRNPYWFITSISPVFMQKRALIRTDDDRDYDGADFYKVVAKYDNTDDLINAFHKYRNFVMDIINVKEDTRWLNDGELDEVIVQKLFRATFMTRRCYGSVCNIIDAMSEIMGVKIRKVNLTPSNITELLYKKIAEYNDDIDVDKVSKLHFISEIKNSGANNRGAIASLMNNLNAIGNQSPNIWAECIRDSVVTYLMINSKELNETMRIEFKKVARELAIEVQQSIEESQLRASELHAEHILAERQRRQQQEAREPNDTSQEQRGDSGSPTWGEDPDFIRTTRANEPRTTARFTFNLDDWTEPQPVTPVDPTV